MTNEVPKKPEMTLQERATAIRKASEEMWAKILGISAAHISRKRPEKITWATTLALATENGKSQGFATTMESFIDPFLLEKLGLHQTHTQFPNIFFHESRALLKPYSTTKDAASPDKDKAIPADAMGNESSIAYEFRAFFMDLDYSDPEAILQRFTIPSPPGQEEKMSAASLQRFQLTSLVCFALLLRYMDANEAKAKLLRELGKSPLKKEQRSTQSPEEIVSSLEMLLEALESKDTSRLEAISASGTASPLIVLRKLIYMSSNLESPAFGGFEAIHKASLQATKEEQKQTFDPLMADLLNFVQRVPKENLDFIRKLTQLLSQR